MTSSNRKMLNTDRHDTMLRGRKLMRIAFKLGLAGGCTWVVLESAKAFSMF